MGITDFRDAKLIGDAGELQVGELLRRHAETNPPARYLSNLMLSVGRMTAQLDHVLVDSQGVLILEVKTWQDAYLRGTADESKWTVVYHGFSKQRTLNPLKQLGSQRNALTKALRDSGPRIEPDSLQSVVVFVGAKVDDLELDGENLRRICTIERLPGYLRERAAAAQVSPLAVQQVLRRYEQVAALDRSEDPSVQRRHAEYRGGAVEPLAAPATAGAEGSGGAPAPLPPQVTWSGNPHRSWSPPPKVDSGSSWSCAGQFGAVAGILAVALLILFGPYLLGQVVGWLGAMASRGPSIFGGVISQAAGSVRPWNWPAAFVAALSFGAAAGLGLWIANGAFGRSFGGRVFEGSVALVARVLQGVFAVAFFVAFMGFLLVALSPQSHASVGAPTLTQAQQALRQVQPAVYGQVADLQSPEVVTDAETTTYTFHVLKKTSTKSATAQAYSVTLGRDGTLRSHKP